MTGLNQWRASIVLTLALLLTCISSCGRSDKPAAALPGVRFGFLESVDHLSFLVMRDQRFDRKYGFRLEEKEQIGGRAALDAMIAGTVDLTYSGSVQIFADARAGRVPRQLVAVGANTIANSRHPAQAVLAGAAVHAWRDLDNQLIAVNQVGSLGEVSARIRLHDEGVEGFRFVEIPFANQGLAVADGTVAAAVMSEPFLTQSLRRVDGAILDWVIGGEPFREFPYTFIVVRTALLRGRPEIVSHFLKAHLDAVAWIAEHDRQARALLARRLALEPGVVRDMRLNPYVADARIDAGLVASAQATLAKADPNATPVPVGDVADETLLREVLRERR